MNKTLIIGATHGNESIGVQALRQLEQEREDFDWVIGNPPAFERGVRYTDADLNRSAPGNVASNKYEERRAAELVALSQKYEATIDLHGTDKETDLFIIITNPSEENIELAKQLNVERVVIWPAITPELEGPVSEFFPCGLEIECGPQGKLSTQKKLEQVLRNFLDQKPPEVEQRFYEVYGQLKEKVDVKLQEFQEVEVNGERFAPLLIGSYKDRYGVSCYKMRPWQKR